MIQRDNVCRRAGLFSSVCVLIAALTVSGQVYAQSTDQANAASNAAAAVTTLPEIVVTAEKRSANLQSVPIAISAITAKEAMIKGLTDTASLQTAVPGLVLTNTGGVASPFIRGVGSNLLDPSAENSVSLVVDGVYIAAPQAGLFDLINLQSVEVLKGPQGTLFGRNATAGVIQITTKTPSRQPSGDVSVSYGNYEDLLAKGYVTAGITDWLAGDLAVLYHDQGQGYGRNLTTGAEIFKQDIGDYALRTKLLFTPVSGTRILFSADFSHSVSNPSYQPPKNDPSVIDPAITYPGPYNTQEDLNSRDQVDTGGVSLQVDQDLGPTKLTSITAYRQSTIKYAIDDDGTPLPIADFNLNSFQHNYSEEIRLANLKDGWLTWVIGGFFYGNNGGYNPVLLDGFEYTQTKQTSWSYAGFTQATAKLPWDTQFSLGARYTSEEQDYIQTYPIDYRASQRFDKFTYRGALDHQFSDNISAYISYDVGFKTGGYNLLDPVIPTLNTAPDVYKPEVLDAEEVGVKTEAFGRRLRINLAAYSYQYQNIQVNIPTAAGSVVENAAAAHLQGVEGDFQWLPIRHLTLSGGFSVADGHYTDLVGLVGRPGNHTAVTPPFTGSLSADYLIKTDWGAVRPAITVVNNSGFYWQPDNHLTQPAYTLLNASTTFSFASNRYDVRLWGKNLTDATYYISRTTVGAFGDGQEQAPPRTFGVTLSAHF